MRFALESGTETSSPWDMDTEERLDRGEVDGAVRRVELELVAEF